MKKFFFLSFIIFLIVTLVSAKYNLQQSDIAPTSTRALLCSLKQIIYSSPNLRALEVSGQHIVFTEFDSALQRDILTIYDIQTGAAKTIDTGSTAWFPRISENDISWTEFAPGQSNPLLYSLGKDGIISGDDIGPVTMYSAVQIPGEPTYEIIASYSYSLIQDIVTFGVDTYSVTGNPPFQKTKWEKTDFYYCATDNPQAGCFIGNITLFFSQNETLGLKAFGIGNSNFSQFIFEERNASRGDRDLMYIDASGRKISLLNDPADISLLDISALAPNGPLVALFFEPYQGKVNDVRLYTAITLAPKLKIPVAVPPQPLHYIPGRISHRLTPSKELFITWMDLNNGKQFLESFSWNGPSFVQHLGSLHGVFYEPVLDGNTLVYRNATQGSQDILVQTCR